MKILCILLTLFVSSNGGKQILTDNQHVTMEVRQPEKLSLVRTAEIAFFFQPLSGIHINTNPLFELKLEKDSPFEIVGKTRFLKTDKEYLDIKKPVEFSIKAKSSVKIGKQVLKGKLNYFYCSDNDGWCNRFSQLIEVTIEVIP
jgi:hypothetical protein